jgi:hypothetical protein
MQPIKAKVSGYKRLAEDCELLLDTDPVCIVGPNGAGKTSFLDALTHLNEGEDFAATERTRVPGGRSLEPRVEARFLLDDKERGLLAEVPEAAEVRQFSVIKEAGSAGLRYTADPYPHRDRGARQEVAAALADLEEEPWFQQVSAVERAAEPAPEPSFVELVGAAKEVADSEVERLEDQAAAFAVLAERLGSIVEAADRRSEAEESGSEHEGTPWPQVSAATRGLPAALAALAESEADGHPLQKVVAALSGRVPRFLKFGAPGRGLEATYDLGAEEPEAEAAIHNFLALAGTDWVEAARVVGSGDRGWKKAYLERLDQNLAERAALVWRQSDVAVQVDLDGTELTILLSMQEDDFIDLEQHSDGLRQFMALRAFIWTTNEIRPVVLVDEADLHLHYDAQADLVDVFEEQREAQKIIYTTHSAGCLPRDLGLGIRAIVPETEEIEGKVIQGDHSRAVNRFWTEGRGLSPLLLAMGAGAFAFSATQRALITEGMSDALLLPSLIREATGEKRLGYQTVAGFAEAGAEEGADLDLIAGRTAFLADGDEGGRRHRDRLVAESGVLPEQILFLGLSETSELAIEDLLDEEVYLRAVNDQLDAWHGLAFPAAELPGRGRGRAVATWCAEQSGRGGRPPVLGKVDIAQRVLDQRREGRELLGKGRRSELRKLDQRVKAIFAGAPARIKKLREAAAAD